MNLFRGRGRGKETLSKFHPIWVRFGVNPVQPAYLTKRILNFG